MAAVAAIILAILRCSQRSLRAAGALTGNNLAAVIGLLIAMEPTDRPSSATVIYMIVGLLWSIPMAREVTRRIPPECFRLWPLGTWQKAVIHGVNIVLNPLIVIAVLFGLLSRDRAMGLGLLMIGASAPFAVLAMDALVRRDICLPLGWIPRLPGAAGGLAQNHLRELLQLLDVWFALIVAAGGVYYCRFFPHSDPAAALVFGHLVVLLMSTLAQGHAGFDADAAQQRLRLMPVSGRAVLFSKDLAWLILALPMIALFPLLPSVAAALTALAMGHRTSAGPPVEQKRWSFASGKLAPEGVLQMIALIAVGAGVNSFGWRLFAVVPLAYAGSLWWSGGKWDEWASL